jgi:pimeloyl-ACP methyl ester carboxylesterase
MTLRVTRILATAGARTGAGIDRTALSVMTRLWLMDGPPESAAPRDQRDALLALYSGDRIERDPLCYFARPPTPEVSVRRRGGLRKGRRERLRWRSGYSTWDPQFQAEYDGHERNRYAWADAYRHDGFGRPTIVCLHSWMAGAFAAQPWLYPARRFYAAGYDVVFPILPFHGVRTQRGLGGRVFPGPDPAVTNEAFRQSVWDVRSLIRILQAERSGPIGVIGMSLGGYVTAVLAGAAPEIAFAVPIIPLVSFADLLWHHGRAHPERAKAEAAGIDIVLLRRLFMAHSPLRLPPQIPRDRLMIVAGSGDRICPREQIEALWDHWDRPRIHWYPGGHIAQFGRRRLFGEIRRFIDGLDLS